MSDQIQEIFADYKMMLKGLKKKSYQENMEILRKNHGAYFQSMVEKASSGSDEDQGAAAETVSREFAEGVFAIYEKRGRVRNSVRVDLSMFMIYYVFPALLLTEGKETSLLCDKLKEAWNDRFRSNIDYTDYETLSASFKEKLMGMF